MFLHVASEEFYSKGKPVTCLKFKANILHKLALKFFTIVKDYESRLHLTELVLEFRMYDPALQSVWNLGSI
jgi:hypothetical protein